MSNYCINLAAITLMSLAGSMAQATDFGPLMDVVRTTWPEKTHIGVVADYRNSREEILFLAMAAGKGNTITVYDVRIPAQVPVARNLLTQKADDQRVKNLKPDYLVLLPSDPLVRDGSPWATYLIDRLAAAGIPTIAATPKALQQGAVFALSEWTGLQLLVADRVIGTVTVDLPKRVPVANVARLDLGSAEISVVGGF